MSRRVFLHVGLPKSGTTYVQALLAAHKEELMLRGNLLFPGTAWHEQVLAVRDVREMTKSWRQREAAEGAWQRLVDEMVAWEGDSIISMEWLCAARAAHVHKILEGLQPARVEVIFTIRDLGRTLPASWQEFMQTRQEWSWSDFLAGVTAEDPYATDPGANFWSQQDIGPLISRWTPHLPSEQVHVVTIPPPGSASSELWDRMASVLGIDPDEYAVDQVRGNPSLGLESAELMRRLNPLTREANIRRSLYGPAFKHGLAKQVLAKRSGDEPKLVLPPTVHVWARARAARQGQEISDSGAHVVGDLRDLEPVLPTEGGMQPEDVADSRLLELCLAALVTMGSQWDTARTTAAESEAAAAKLETTAEKLRTDNRRLARRVKQLDARVRRLESHPYRAALRAGVNRVRPTRP